MKSKVLVLVSSMIILAAAASAQQTVFSTQIEISPSAASINELNVTQGDPMHSTAVEPTHRVILLNGRGEDIYIHELTVTYRLTTHGSNNTVDKRIFYLRLPYTYSAETLKVEKIEGEETLTEEELPGMICVKDDRCPAYCAGRGIDSDCTDIKGESRSLIEKLIGLVKRILEEAGRYVSRLR